MMKEVKASERSLKKRNAAGALDEIKENIDINASHGNCLEYASKCKKVARIAIKFHNNLNNFNWSLLNEIKKMRLLN